MPSSPQPTPAVATLDAVDVVWPDGSVALTGLDLALPASGDPVAQDELVRRTIARVMPDGADLSIERTETAGLLDAGAGRAYLASIDGPALPLEAGRWPATASEAALGSTVAETLDVEIGDTFDLGGRTFDATVLRMGADGLEVLGSPEGVEHLGGDDFDDAVRGLLDQRVGGRISALDAADPDDAATLAAIDEACTLAKEALSVREETVVRLPLDDADHPITIMRADLERSIRPAVGLAVAALLRTIHSAGIDADAV